MTTSGGTVYQGPSGTTAIVAPLVIGTTYQSALTTPMFLYVIVACTVSTLADEAVASIFIGPTLSVPDGTGNVGVLSESGVFGGTFRFQICTLVPPLWYYKLAQTVAGSGAVTSITALALT